jgi:hypothetical protein
MEDISHPDSAPGGVAFPSVMLSTHEFSSSDDSHSHNPSEQAQDASAREIISHPIIEPLIASSSSDSTVPPPVSSSSSVSFSPNKRVRVSSPLLEDFDLPPLEPDEIQLNEPGPMMPSIDQTNQTQENQVKSSLEMPFSSSFSSSSDFVDLTEEDEESTTNALPSAPPSSQPVSSSSYKLPAPRHRVSPFTFFPRHLTFVPPLLPPPQPSQKRFHNQTQSIKPEHSTHQPSLVKPNPIPPIVDEVNLVDSDDESASVALLGSFIAGLQMVNEQEIHHFDIKIGDKIILFPLPLRTEPPNAIRIDYGPSSLPLGFIESSSAHTLMNLLTDQTVQNKSEICSIQPIKVAIHIYSHESNENTINAILRFTSGGKWITRHFPRYFSLKTSHFKDVDRVAVLHEAGRDFSGRIHINNSYVHPELGPDVKSLESDFEQLFHVEDLSQLPQAVVPQHLVTTMYPYQRQGLEWMKRREQGKKEKLLFWEKKANGTWINVLTQEVKVTLPEQGRGGLLADEMVRCE